MGQWERKFSNPATFRFISQYGHAMIHPFAALTGRFFSIRVLNQTEQTEVNQNGQMLAKLARDLLASEVFW